MGTKEDRELLEGRKECYFCPALETGLEELLIHSLSFHPLEYNLLRHLAQQQGPDDAEPGPASSSNTQDSGHKRDASNSKPTFPKRRLPQSVSPQRSSGHQPKRSHRHDSDDPKPSRVDSKGSTSSDFSQRTLHKKRVSSGAKETTPPDPVPPRPSSSKPRPHLSQSQSRREKLENQSSSHTKSTKNPSREPPSAKWSPPNGRRDGALESQEAAFHRRRSQSPPPHPQSFPTKRRRGGSEERSFGEVRSANRPGGSGDMRVGLGEPASAFHPQSCKHNKTPCFKFPFCSGRLCPFLHPPCPEGPEFKPCIMSNHCPFHHPSYEKTCFFCSDKYNPTEVKRHVIHCPHTKEHVCRCRKAMCEKTAMECSGLHGPCRYQGEEICPKGPRKCDFEHTRSFYFCPPCRKAYSRESRQ